jgi:(2R)-3-sulfolactate dehydrogenase (NADP+)
MTDSRQDPPATIDARRLVIATEELLAQSGMTRSNARVSARAIVLADTWGTPSHGVLRMPSYLRRLQAGGVNSQARLRRIRRSPSVSAFDGEAGLGHWQVWRGVEVAARLATRNGAGVVAIGNSSHCGALGVYAACLRRTGAAGIVLSNGPAAMPAWGGTTTLVSTSPIAGTVPSDGDGPVVDLALSTVTRGEIARLARSGGSLPQGVAFDAHGEATTDPGEALNGMIAPIGGPKGFALAYLLEALTGGLVGPALSSEVVDPFDVARAGEAQRVAHLVIAIRPDAIDTDGLGAGRLRRLAKSVEASGGRVPGAGRGLRPSGRVPLAADLTAELLEWAGRLGAGTAESILSGVRATQ